MDAEEPQNDISVTKFLDGNPNDVSVTKFLDSSPNDVSVTKFLDDNTNVAEGGNPYFNQSHGRDAHNRNVNMTIIQFLNSLAPADENEISVTKFLEGDSMVTQ